MLALLSLGFFLHFAVVGAGVVAALHTQRDLVRNVLIAPAVGFIVTVPPTYLLSRAGLPVGTFGRPLAIAMLAAATAFLLWRRPLIPWRRVVPYAAIAACAFALVGWPLIFDDFRWLGEVNPDMSNYLLRAQRFLIQGFAQPPDPEVWRNQTDWSSYFLTFEVLGIRAGADLLLAWAAAAAAQATLAVYFPLLVAMHVAMICAAAALVPTPHRLARLLSAVALASSAMLTVAVVLELIAQMAGLACLALACVLTLSPFYRWTGALRRRAIVLAGIVMATFILVYPEILPFFGVAFLAYHLAHAASWRPTLGRGLAAVALIGTLACILTAPDVLGLLGFLVEQTAISANEQRLPELFPYFLVPSGVSAFWGLHRYASEIEPSSWTIAVGFALSIAALIGCVRGLVRRQAPAFAASGMILMIPILFLGDSGFGLLKVSMFAQPFLLPAAVIALCGALRVAR